MYLLNIETTKGWTRLRRKRFLGDIPPYAILSHRWGEDEMTFQDIPPGSFELDLCQNNIALANFHLPGWAKVWYCGRQALADGISYFWVDTVCIDKTSSAELTEALNSMYKWYALAEKCYVYMSDVERLDPDFASSAWFTRGWTLQELLAPRTVEFFSKHFTLLATRRFLLPQLAEITGIPEQALQNGDLHAYSVEERIGWMRNRRTSRPEDMAYCLMGIFSVFMPVIYGEGENAMVRLEDEIEKKRLREFPSPKFGECERPSQAVQRQERRRQKVSRKWPSETAGDIFSWL